MPRAGLSESVVVDLALTVVDDVGPEFTLAQVAEHAGVATPSLYKHVGGLGALRSLAAARALDQLSDAVEMAIEGNAGPEAVLAALYAYRNYAVSNPNRYALIPPQPLQQEELISAAHRLITLIERAVGGTLDDPETVHKARALRSAAHGFAALETTGGFGIPVDLDTSFDVLARAVVSGLQL